MIRLQCAKSRDSFNEKGSLICLLRHAPLHKIPSHGIAFLSHCLTMRTEPCSCNRKLPRNHKVGTCHRAGLTATFDQDFGLLPTVRSPARAWHRERRGALPQTLTKVAHSATRRRRCKQMKLTPPHLLSGKMTKWPASMILAMSLLSSVSLTHSKK